MSTLPLGDLRKETPAHSLKRILLVSGGILLVLAWIYSGTAWIWLRPVVQKPLINRYAGEYKFDPLWVMSIIKTESRFSPGAHSSRGALGLMQLLPSTARELAPEIGLLSFKDTDLTQPDINLHLGVYYLTKLEREFPDDEIAVLAAYNAGPGITRQWLKGKPALQIEDIDYPETRRFVEQVQGTYEILKTIQRFKRFLGLSHAS